MSGQLSRLQKSSLDAFGDPLASSTATYKVEGFPSRYSDFYRAKFGIPDTDLKIVLIAGNCEVKPEKEDVITFSGTSYQTRTVEIDPAGATYICQAYEI